MASPDAMVRLKETPLVEEKSALCQIYTMKQHHMSLEDFLIHSTNTHTKHHSTKGVLMQVVFM